VTGKFFNKRREIRCPFCDPHAIRELCGLVDRTPALDDLPHRESAVDRDQA
jgi:hypothetical protein